MRRITYTTEDISGKLAGGNYTLDISSSAGEHIFTGPNVVTGTLNITSNPPTQSVMVAELFIPADITVSGFGEILLFGEDITPRLGVNLHITCRYILGNWYLSVIDVIPDGYVVPTTTTTTTAIPTTTTTTTAIPTTTTTTTAVPTTTTTTTSIPTTTTTTTTVVPTTTTTTTWVDTTTTTTTI